LVAATVSLRRSAVEIRIAFFLDGG
jgi:hypothetical protein